MRIARPATALAALVIAAGAHAAGAATFCVADPSCTGKDEASLPAALSDAGSPAYPSRDRIVLGTGTIPYAGAATDAAGNPVDVVGAGRHDTTLQASGPVLSMQEPSSTLSDVRVSVSGTPGTVIDLVAGTVHRVDVDATSVDGGATPVAFLLGAGGAVVDDSVVALAAGPSGTAVRVDAAGAATAPAVSNLIVTGGTGVRAVAGTVTVDDALLRPSSGALGITADAGGTGTAAIVARQVTVLLASAGTGIDAGGGGSVTADGVAIHGTGMAVAARAAGTVTLDYSAYPFTEVTGAPTGGMAHHDVDLATTAPGFLDESAGDARLTAASPLVDAGDPALTAGPGVDLAGLPRVRDGNGYGTTAVRDIGAYEYQHVAPTVGVSATPTSAGTDQEVAFTAVAADADAGETPAVTWTFDDGAQATGPTASHAFSTAGDHTATATATDPSGLTATSTVTVHVTSDNAPPPATARGPALYIRILRARLDRQRTFLIGVFCPYTARPRCTGSVTVRRSTATIARTALRIQAAGTQIARLRVSRATADLLHRRRLLGAVATVVAQNVEGNTTTRTFRVTLRPFR